MSKESYIGGDYIETTGGSTKIYAKEDIENSSAMHFAQKGDDDGVVYGVNEDAPTITVTRKIIRLEITNEITFLELYKQKQGIATRQSPEIFHMKL